jgi:hypothetical protein
MKAFARPASEAHLHGMHQHQEGMDLRDYFAAKIMSEMNWVNAELSAQECYRIADAMMKARNAK